jgi:hypothetical protein
MNITIGRMKPTVSTLRGVREELKRIADCLEMYLANEHNLHVRPPKADTSGAEPQAIYTDELAMLIEEFKEQQARTGTLGRDRAPEE